MGTQLQLSATLIEAPQTASEDAFPSATTNIPFELNCGDQPKQVQVSTGRQLVNVNSPGAFVQLSGVGAGQTVTQALTVFMRSRSGQLLFRVTYNGQGTPAVLPSHGVFLHEADESSYVTKLEVQGIGLIEYYASGIQ